MRKPGLSIEHRQKMFHLLEFWSCSVCMYCKTHKLFYKLFEGIDDMEVWHSYSVEIKPYPTLDDIIKKCEAWGMASICWCHYKKNWGQTSPIYWHHCQKTQGQKRRKELIKFIDFKKKHIEELKKKKMKSSWKKKENWKG